MKTAAYPDFKDAVLVIHTKNNGEISEVKSGKKKEELKKLRKQSNEIDSRDSPCKAIVSVMMLKEGWDVKNVTDYRSVVGYFTRVIMKDLRLVSGYDVLYGKVKYFIQDELFEKPVDLENLNTLRNLSELEANKTLVEIFKKQINDLTVQDKGDAKIHDTISLKKTRPFVAKEQGYIIPKKSIFNKIIGDSNLELQFAASTEPVPMKAKALLCLKLYNRQ